MESRNLELREQLRQVESDKRYIETQKIRYEREVRKLKSEIEQLQAKEVRETTFAGFPAYQFSIQWPGKERIIIFIDRGDILYRIIHDPVSPINKKILENIQFLRSNKS